MNELKNNWENIQNYYSLYKILYAKILFYKIFVIILKVLSKFVL